MALKIDWLWTVVLLVFIFQGVSSRSYYGPHKMMPSFPPHPSYSDFPQQRPLMSSEEDFLPSHKMMPAFSSSISSYSDFPGSPRVIREGGGYHGGLGSYVGGSFPVPPMPMMPGVKMPMMPGVKMPMMPGVKMPMMPGVKMPKHAEEMFFKKGGALRNKGVLDNGGTYAMNINTNVVDGRREYSSSIGGILETDYADYGSNRKSFNVNKNHKHKSSLGKPSPYKYETQIKPTVDYEYSTEAFGTSKPTKSKHPFGSAGYGQSKLGHRHQKHKSKIGARQLDYDYSSGEESTEIQIKRVKEFLSFVDKYPGIGNLKNMPTKMINFIVKTPQNVLGELIQQVTPTMARHNIDSQAASYILFIQHFPPDFTGREIKEIIIELEQFIVDIVTEHNYAPLSDNLIYVIEKHKEIPRIVEDIFESHNQNSEEIDTETIVNLLVLLKNIRTKNVIKDIPLHLIDLILKLDGAKDVATHVLNWLRQHKSGTMLQLFLQVVEQNGGKAIPAYLHEWLLKLSNGAEIIAFLEKPGKIKCEQTSDGGVKCTKTTKKLVSKQRSKPGRYYTESSGEVEYGSKQRGEHGHVMAQLEEELVDFIYAISNHTFIDISPELFKFVMTEPDLYWFVVALFERYGIPEVENMPLQIYSVLKLLEGYKNQEEPAEVDPALLQIVINLKGGKYLTGYILDSVLEYNSDSMIEFLMEVIYNNNGYIPKILRDWIANLSNGEDILRFLQSPGEIKCAKAMGGGVECFKSSIGDYKHTRHDYPDEEATYGDYESEEEPQHYTPSYSYGNANRNHNRVHRRGY